MGKDLLIEEVIPHSLKMYLKKESLDEILIDELFDYSYALFRLGFDPIDPFSDLMTDGKHIYVVDFGEDLGPYGLQTEKSAKHYFDLTLDWLSQNRIQLPPKMRINLIQKFK